MSQAASNGAGQSASQGPFVKFTRPAAQRIAKAVMTVERGNRDQGPVTFEHPIGDAVKVRHCAWTGTWNMGSTAVIQFTGSARTATAYNAYHGWREPSPPNSGAGIVFRYSGAWRLHGIDLETVQGYTAVSLTSTLPAYQILGHEIVNDAAGEGEASGAPGAQAYLKWFQVTACTTS